MENGQSGIRSGSGLKRWLDHIPPETSRIIAMRAALRVLPLVGEVLAISEKRLNARQKQGLIAAILRASIISWTVGNYPARELTAIAAARGAEAAARAAEAANPANHALRAAAHAARALARAADATIHDHLAVDAAAGAADAIHTARSIDTSYEARAAFWESVEEDVSQSVPSVRPEIAYRILAAAPLWGGEGTPNWMLQQWDNLRTGLLDMDPNWDALCGWYTNRLRGRTKGFNVRDDKAEDLDIRIASRSDEWWARDPAKVNADIAQWVEEARDKVTLPEQPSTWDYFISYSVKDRATAEQIGHILESAGSTVFAQYKDMPPGSNFVREMQRGMAGSGRTIALLSPNYEASDHCQAEFAVAYNADPSGARRKLLPFLVRPAELNPLSRQIVYKSLVGLSPEQRRDAVLEAVSYTPPARDLQSAKRDLASVASPIVREKVEGGRTKIDIAPNPDVDSPIAGADLHELPNLQRQTASVIVASLPQNAPPVIRHSLEAYADHLRQRGVRPFTGFIRQFASVIQRELDLVEAELWTVGLEELFQGFFRNHSLFMAHFPLSESRERIIAETPINESEAVGQTLSEPIEEVAEACEALSEIEFTTEDFDDFIETLQREAADLASVPPPPPDRSQPTTLVTPKRRYVHGAIGFLERLYAFVGATASIAATPQGQALLVAIRNAIDKLAALLLLG